MPNLKVSSLPISFSSQIFFGGLAAWFSRATGVLLNLVLMPVLFRNLPREELGIWFLLGQSWAVLGVFDFGFGSILARRVAFAMEMRSNQAKARLTNEAIAEISEVFATCRILYRWLGLLAFVLSMASGALYMHGLALRSVSVNAALVAWSVLCLANAAGLWASTWTSLLRGLGYVGWDSILASLVNAGTLLAQVVCVCMGGHLVSLAIVAAAGALTQRWATLAFIRRSCSGLDLQGRWSTKSFRGMAPYALRGWITSLGYLLVANTDQFFVIAYNNASALPAYRAAFLLMINLHILAGVFSGASPIFVSRLWQSGDAKQIRLILKRNAQIGLLSLACGGAAILVLGPALFQVWLGSGNFIGYPVLVIFLLTFILEHHANVFSSCGRATNDEAYAFWSIAAGLLKVTFAWILTKWFGLAGLALSTLLAQALTTDWFMVYRSSVRLAVDFSDHLRQVIIPCSLVLAGVAALGSIGNLLTLNQRPEIRIAVVVAIASLTLLGSAWVMVLDQSQKARLFSFLGLLGSKPIGQAAER